MGIGFMFVSAGFIIKNIIDLWKKEKRERKKMREYK